MRRITVLAVAVWLCLGSGVLAQDAVPSEMLFKRTFFIKVGNATGTAFSIDYGGKIYWVTARHIANGLPESNATIQVHRNDRWEDFHTLKTLFPPSIEADIAVLETDEKASEPFKVTTAGKGGGRTM